MAKEFNKDKLDMFLGAVRKYMQVRGPMSQKDLADQTDTGVSTMSRFLNQQTKELNPTLIAKIVASLNIPLHEIIDFVEEPFADHFIRLVKLHKGEAMAAPGEEGVEAEPTRTMTQTATMTGAELDDEEEGFADALGAGTARQNASAKIKVGGRSHTVSYEGGGGDEIRDKLKSLTARQKGFLHDFLNLDMDGRDLVVDIGKNIISYLRQKGIDF